MAVTTPESSTRATFEKMVSRLNKLSVSNHHDAYDDVAWDDPEMQLEPADPRLRLYTHDPLVGTAWYQGLTDADKSRVALYRLASTFKTGWQFENLLQRGLLTLAWDEPNGAPAFRYMHHELIEESQHTLMFQEYVNRSDLPVEGMSRFWRFVAPPLVRMSAAIDKPLFFLLVLGGEEPIDQQQRLMLREGGRHPLNERIMRIHVTEEARHISFARHWLQQYLPGMGRLNRFLLSLRFPLVVGIMVRIMLVPPPDLRRHCGLPDSVVRDAYRSPKGREQFASSAAKLRALADTLGLMNPMSRRLWDWFGLTEQARR